MPQVVFNCPLFPQQISVLVRLLIHALPARRTSMIEFLERLPLLARIRTWLQVRATVDENC
jgi:hypothetical protein